MRIHVPTELVLGAVAPIVTYQVLSAFGASDVTALAWGAVFPLAGVVVGVLRKHRLDAVSALSLFAVVGSVAGGLLLHSAQFLLVKDSIVTGLIGLGFLGSLLARRPLIYALAGAHVPEEALEARWTDPAFRNGFRRMTVVWGCALLGEAALRVVLVFTLPPNVVVLASPVLAALVLGPVGLWTVRRRAALRARTSPPVPAAA